MTTKIETGRLILFFILESFPFVFEVLNNLRSKEDIGTLRIKAMQKPIITGDNTDRILLAVLNTRL